MLFRQVSVDGELRDVRLGATIEAIAPTLAPKTGEEVVEGGLLAPPSAEPHVHLDAVLLGARRPNRTGTLREGIANWAELRAELTTEDVIARASTVVGWYA